MACLEKEPTMTLAERRAAARRQKILANQEGRMGRILGTSNAKIESEVGKKLSPDFDLSPKENTFITNRTSASLSNSLMSDLNCNPLAEQLKEQLPSLALLLNPNAQQTHTTSSKTSCIPDQRVVSDEKRIPSNNSLNLWKTITFLTIAILGIWMEYNMLFSFLLVQGLCLPHSFMSWKQETNRRQTDGLRKINSQEYQEKSFVDNSHYLSKQIHTLIHYRAIISNLFGEFILFVFLSLTSFSILVLMGVSLG